MSREYATLRPSFWTGHTGRELRGHHAAQTLAAYVCSCLNGNICGVYYLPLPLICHDLGMSFEDAQEGLRRLSDEDFAHYSEPCSYIWVVNLAREAIGDNPNLADNRVMGVRRELEKHRKCPFYEPFRERYAAIFADVPEPSVPGQSTAARKAPRSPSNGGGGSGSGSGSGSGTRERETRARSPDALRKAAAESETRDDETLTPAHLSSIFRAKWLQLRSDDPPEPHFTDVVKLAERVNNTAEKRSVPPVELLTSTIEHFASCELNAREKRTPFQCFATAFGEIVDVTHPLGGNGLSTADALSKQSSEALRDGDIERYEQLQNELSALNGGGRAVAH